MSPAKGLLVLILWLAYAWIFGRAWVGRQKKQKFYLRVWIMFLYVCIAFPFTGWEIEALVDSQFGGLPVSIYIKYFCLTQITYHYFRLTQEVTHAFNRVVHFLIVLGPLSFVGGVVSFAARVVLNVRFHPDTRYYVSAARDGIMSVYLLTSIIPTNLSVWREEAVPTMRVKHGLNTLLCITYVAVAITSLVSVFIVHFRVMAIEPLLPYFAPLTTLCYFLFLTALLPHRWVAVLLYPQRLYTYVRLRRLRKVVERLTPQVAGFGMGEKLLSLGQLEFAIYQTVIFILDRAPLLQSPIQNDALPQQVNHLLTSRRNYPALVKELSELCRERSHTR